MSTTYMLDTNICSFIMRERPRALLERLEACVGQRGVVVVSAITYAEMRFGAMGPKASPRHGALVDQFVKRLDGVLPWDMHAVDATTQIRVTLAQAGTPIGSNDAAIAGHALATQCVLVTNNVREFQRVPGLNYEDWTR